MVFAWLINGLCILLVTLAVKYMLTQRQRRKRARAATRGLMTSPLSGLMMGAMLLGFQAIVQPETRHTISAQQEESVEDENGDEPTGGRQFHRQLQKIRAGESISRLEVKL